MDSCTTQEPIKSEDNIAQPFWRCYIILNLVSIVSNYSDGELLLTRIMGLDMGWIQSMGRTVSSFVDSSAQHREKEAEQKDIMASNRGYLRVVIFVLLRGVIFGVLGQAQGRHLQKNCRKWLLFDPLV